MHHSRLSRRALLATLGSAVAATAGCTAPSESLVTSTPGGTDASPDDAGSGSGDASADDPTVSLSGEDAWTTYGYDAGHTGFNPNAAGPSDDPGIAWGSAIDGIYTLREPAVADGRVFVGSDELTWAFDATTGEDLWQRSLGGMTHHFAPTHRDGVLYAVSKDSSGVNNGADGAVHALDPESGDPEWQTSLPVTSTVAVAGDRVYVAAKADDAGFVQALDADTGDRRWRFDVPDAPASYVTGAPTAVDDTLYVAATHVGDDGATSGELYALDPESEDVDWTVETDAALPVAPVVTDENVFLAARDGTVRALSRNGDGDWTVDAGARVYSRPSYANGRLFVLTAADIVAFGDGGERLWEAASDRTQTSGLSVAGDTLYVGGEPLFALDVTDGDVVFDLPVDVYHGAYGAPVVVDDVLYAGICIKDDPGSVYDNYVRAYVSPEAQARP